MSAKAIRGIRGHVRSNFVGYVALLAFAIVSGADAVDGPVAGTNTIGSEDIIGGEVKSGDIGDGRIFNLDIADDVILSGKVKNATLTGADFAPNSLTGDDVNEGTFYGDDSLTTADVNESSLFNDDSLTTLDFFSSAADTDEIIAGAVGTAEIENDTLSAGDLAANSVGAGEIAAGAVRANELAPVVTQRAAGTVAAGQRGALFVGCPTGYAPFNVGYAGAPGLVTIGTSPITSGGELSGFAVDFDNPTGESKAAEIAALCLEA